MIIFYRSEHERRAFYIDIFLYIWNSWPSRVHVTGHMRKQTRAGTPFNISKPLTKLQSSLKYKIRGQVYNSVIFQSNSDSIKTCLPPVRSELKSQPDFTWESWKMLAVGRQFTVQNLDQLYVLVSSALPTTRHNINDEVLGVM